jgi:hypothetical protein
VEDEEGSDENETDEACERGEAAHKGDETACKEV